MIVIDTHGHIVPQSFPPLPVGVPAAEWPQMVPLEDGRARMMIAGEEFRVFEAVYWDMAARVAHLDREGVAIQVLSPLPELLGYWFDVRTTTAIAHHLHATIAKAVGDDPTRLVGLGMLPLQDIGASVAMVAEIVQVGLRGILVASNVNGVSVADTRFDPVWAEMERCGLAIYVHGYRPAGAERLIGSPLLTPIVGVPQDTGAAVASFIMTDVLGRFPGLKLGFVHGGGTFGAVVDRMDYVWAKFPPMQTLLKTSPRDYVRRFAFDSVTFSIDYLRYLIAAFGSDAMMAGSDGPTPIGQTGLEAFITAACDGDEAIAEKILWRNAARFFALDDVVAAHSPAPEPA